MKNTVKVITWGRSYPCRVCQDLWGIELPDIQKYAIYNVWFRDFIIWLESTEMQVRVRN